MTSQNYAKLTRVDSRPVGSSVFSTDRFLLARDNGVSLVSWAAILKAQEAYSAVFDVTAYVAEQPGGEAQLELIKAGNLAAQDGTIVSMGIEAALNARQSVSGPAAVVFPGGEWLIDDSVTIYSDTEYLFQGVPGLYTSDGANCNVMETENYIAAGVGGFTDAALATEGFAITGRVKLNGNMANNTNPGAHEGNGLAIWGRDFTLEDPYVEDCYRSGVQTRYASTGTTSPFNGRVGQLTVDVCGEHGWVNQVSDLQFGQVNIASPGQNADNTWDAYHGIKGARGSGMTIWRKGVHTNKHRYGIHAVGGAFKCSLVSVETAESALVRVDGLACSVEGRIYNLIGSNVPAISLAGDMHKADLQITQGGLGSPTLDLVEIDGASRCDVRVRTSTPFGGVVKYTGASLGANRVDVRYRGNDQSPVIASGTPHPTDEILFVQADDVLDNNRVFHKKPAGAGVVAATGSTQGTAAEFNYEMGRAFPNSTSEQGIILPAAIPGMQHKIQNTSGARVLKVYPQPGENFYALAADAPYDIPADGAVEFFCTLTGTWSVAG